MQQIEFETVLQNGMISIPVEHLKNLPEKSKVMVKIESLSDESVFKRRFRAVSIRTKGFKFNRDEANAR